MYKYIFSVFLIFGLSGCETARVLARVKPDRSTELPLGPENKIVPVDIYVSEDGLVGLQIYNTMGNVHDAHVHALLQNNQKVPIEVDLSATRITTTTNSKVTNNVPALDAGGENGKCNSTTKERTREKCFSNIITLAPGESRRVYWSLSRFTTELRLPIKKGTATTLITSRFKNCRIEMILGKIGCDTVY